MGGLGVVITLVATLALIGIGTVVGGPTTVWVGLGIALGGAGTLAFGWWINVTRPAQQTERWAQERGQELDHLVRTGQFQLAPGIPQPSSMDEAQTQAGQLLASERAHVTQRLSNVHTLYFIPLQWAGIAVIAIGAAVMVIGLF